MGESKNKKAQYGLTYDQIIPEKKCKKCGKIFVPAPMHRYREGSKYYCSWTCYLHRKDMEVRKKDDQRTT